MDMHAVTSSNIEALGHEGSTLAVRFKGGSTFHYDGVSQDKFNALRQAKSVGSAFHSQIRGQHDGVPQPKETPPQGR